jgi:lysophospholipase L1-like esterase
MPITGRPKIKVGGTFQDAVGRIKVSNTFQEIWQAANPIPVTPIHWWDFSDDAQVSVDGTDVIQVNDKQGNNNLIFPSGFRPELVSFGDQNCAAFRADARGNFSSALNIDEDDHTFLVISNAKIGGTDNYFFGGGAYSFYWRALVGEHGLAYFDTGPKNSTTVTTPHSTEGEDPDLSGVYGLRAQYIRSGSGGVELGDGITKDASFAAAPVSNSQVVYYRARGDGGVLGSGNDVAALYFDRQLTPTEIDQVLEWASVEYGVPVATFANRPVVVCDGDSLTDGYVGANYEESTSYPAQLSTSYNLNGSRILNNGIDGDRISTDTTAARTVAALAAYPSASKKVVLFFKGGNDLYIDGDSDSVVSTNMAAWIAAVRAAEPSTIIVGATIPARSNSDPTGLSALNDYIRNTADFDYVVDLRAIPEMDDPADTLDTTYYIFDRIHFTDQGYRLITKAFADVLKGNGIL